MWTALINFALYVVGRASRSGQIAQADVAICETETKVPAVAGFVRRVEHLKVVGESIPFMIPQSIDRHLAARLASVAKLNTKVGRKPFDKPRLSAVKPRPKLAAGETRKRHPANAMTRRFPAAAMIAMKTLAAAPCQVLQFQQAA